MRITLVSNGYPPEQIGGTETYAAGVARTLQARGHDVEVVCGGRWTGGERYWGGVTQSNVDGVTLRRVHVDWTKAPDPFRYLFDNPVIGQFFTEHLATRRPDVVHVLSCERLSASVIPAARLSGVPTVLTLTDFWFLCPRMTLLRTDGHNCENVASPDDCLECLSRHAKVSRWTRATLPGGVAGRVLRTIGQTPVLSRQRGVRGMLGDMDGRQRFLREAFRCADYRTTASAFVRDRFLRHGFTEPVHVRPYGHDISWHVDRSDERRSREGRLVLGYIGQIDRHKGVHVILDAIARLPVALQQRLELQVWGDLSRVPAYGRELQARAASLPGVHFRGTYQYAQSGEVFSGFDVLVVPSLWYDFPLIVHEAFASGAPVVATRIGGMAETVRDEVDGLLFERGDVGACAAAFRRLLDEPGLLARLRRGIRPVPTMAAAVDDIEAVYEDVTSVKTCSRA